MSQGQSASLLQSSSLPHRAVCCLIIVPWQQATTAGFVVCGSAGGHQSRIEKLSLRLFSHCTRLHLTLLIHDSHWPSQVFRVFVLLVLSVCVSSSFCSPSNGDFGEGIQHLGLVLHLVRNCPVPSAMFYTVGSCLLPKTPWPYIPGSVFVRCCFFLFSEPSPLPTPVLF